jgi:hypothetical protein
VNHVTPTYLQRVRQLVDVLGRRLRRGGDHLPDVQRALPEDPPARRAARSLSPEERDLVLDRASKAWAFIRPEYHFVVDGDTVVLLAGEVTKAEDAFARLIFEAGTHCESCQALEAFATRVSQHLTTISDVIQIVVQENPSPHDVVRARRRPQ